MLMEFTEDCFVVIEVADIDIDIDTSLTTLRESRSEINTGDTGREGVPALRLTNFCVGKSVAFSQFVNE